jgi:hypothetical protein
MLPKFLLGDNTDHPDTVFVIHTEYPRFVLNLENDEIEFFDDVEEEDEAELTDELTQVVEAAVHFYERELDRYDEEE